MYSERWLARVAAVAIVGMQGFGCSLVAGAFAHHNSRGTACVDTPAPAMIDLFAAGAMAVALGVNGTGASGEWLAPAGLGAIGVTGSILAARCRGEHREERERRRRMRYRQKGVVRNPQAIRYPRDHADSPKVTPKADPVPSAPSDVSASDTPASNLRLSNEYTDPYATEPDEPVDEAACTQHQLRCPDGYVCQLRVGVERGRCVLRRSESE